MNLWELGASRSAVYWRLVKVKLSVKYLDVGLGAAVVLRAIIKGEKGCDCTIKKKLSSLSNTFPILAHFKATLKNLFPSYFLSAPLL